MDPAKQTGAKRKMPPPVPREDDLDGVTEVGPNRYRNLVNNPHMADMTFVVGARQVEMPGHSTIVGMTSSILLDQVQNMNVDNPAIVIRDISPDIWMLVLKFMYGHRIDEMLTEENILGCLKCALRFRLEILRNKCAYFIRSRHLLQDDNIPAHMMDSVTITEAIRLRQHVLTYSSISIFSLQWRCPFVLNLQGVTSKTVRRLACLNLRNLEAPHVLNSIIAWFREECRAGSIPMEFTTLRHFLLDRCTRLNFPAMTAGQFFACIHGCTEINMPPEDVQQIRAGARYRRRIVSSEPRRRLDYILSKDPKAGIFEVPFLQTLYGIQTPRRQNTYNRTFVTIKVSKTVIIHGFAVPVPKDKDECVTLIIIGEDQRALDVTTSSGMRRLFDSNYDIQYVLLDDPIFMDGGKDYRVCLRAHNNSCSVFGRLHEEVTVNGATFFYRDFQQSYCHALFMLFEDLLIYPEANTMSMFDLVAFVPRFSSASSSSNNSAEGKGKQLPDKSVQEVQGKLSKCNV